MAQNDNLGRSIKNDILNMKGGGFDKELECFGYNIPKNIYLKKIIKNGVKKIVGTPAFVLALTDDGRILGFGAQESWGFGVPTYKNITDGAGEWIWNHESDDSMTVEDDMRLGFMGSAFRNIFGEIYVKDFNSLDEEVTDIAASTSIFGAITKSGKIYVWGQKDRYGISAQSSEENISNTILYKILHSINCPTRLFFGKQYIYVVDNVGVTWMWGGIENKIYDFPHSIEEPEVFKPGQITSKKPVMAPISLEFDGRSKIGHLELPCVLP
ncbi:hypothetical protein GCM10011497_37210 [Elstera cyanobacteriorum]|nr:hypothetical protein GCM10011497_37210 [Elstera cyanobacteriorum]